MSNIPPSFRHPRGFVIFQFELPFKLPIVDEHQAYSKLSRVAYIFHLDITTNKTIVETIFFSMEAITSDNKGFVISNAFNESLIAINQFIEALILKFPFPHIHRIEKPQIKSPVQCKLIRSHNFNTKTTENIFFVISLANNYSSTPTSNLTSSQLDELMFFIVNFHENPLTDSTLYNRYALKDINDCRYNESIIKNQTSAELFIYLMVKQSYLVQETKTEKEILNILKTSFKNLLNHHLKPFVLQHSDNFDELDEYINQLYNIRNEIVHAGYRASEEEACRANEALHNFFKKIILIFKNDSINKNIFDISKYATDDV